MQWGRGGPILTFPRIADWHFPDTWSVFRKQFPLITGHQFWPQELGWSLWMWCLEGRLGPQPSGIVSRVLFWASLEWPYDSGSMWSLTFLLNNILQPCFASPRLSSESQQDAWEQGYAQAFGESLSFFYFRFCLYLLRAAASGYCPPPLSSRKMWNKNCDCHSKGD